MSGFHSQTLPKSATASAVVVVPRIGVRRAAASRGMPRMVWMPNFNPSACTASASGRKPAPSTELGNRPGSGMSRPCSSSCSGASALYPWLRAVGSDQSMSTTTVSQPNSSRCCAMNSAFASTSASVTVVP